MGIGSASAASSHTVAVAEAANGKTVLVHVGDRVAISLASTYWQFGAVSGKSVRSLGEPTVAPGGPECPRIPGTGCGTVVFIVKAVAKGTSTVTATRTSCGEAMRCAPDQGAYAVRIKVV